MADTLITADPIVLDFGIKQSVVTKSPPAPRNSSLDTTFDCADYDPVTDEPDMGVIVMEMTIEGHMLNQYMNADPIDMEITLEGRFVHGVTIAADPIVIPFEMGVAEFILGVPKINFVAWSDIGDANFQMDYRNVIGEMPMEYGGFIYALKKLGNFVMVYGKNGVSKLFPVIEPAVTYGMETLRRVGLKGKNAVTGDENTHWIIDSDGCLLEVTVQGLKLLDYREYLGQLTSDVVMFFNPKDGLIYICDGVRGFVYNAQGGLGQGPANITGYGYKDDQAYVTAPEDIVVDPLSVCTDILDLQTRGVKTVMSVELGTDAPLNTTIEVALDYRRDKVSDWQTSQWYRVKEDGRAYMCISAVEFRVRVRLVEYAYLEIDYSNAKFKFADGEEAKA